MYIPYMSGRQNPALPEEGFLRSSTPTLGFSRSRTIAYLQDF